MNRKLLVAAFAALLLLPAFAADKAEKEKKERDRFEESAVVLKEILGMEGIPRTC